MTRRRKIVLLVGAAMPLLVIGGVLLYLRFADLSGWRDTAAKLASDAIGRELRIDGQFRPEFGLTTRLVAGDVTLANAAWSAEPHMVAIHTLEASIDVLSIITGPITLRDITIDGARVIFETSSDGRFNWNLGSGEPSAPPGGDVELVITGAKLTDIDLSYARPGGPPIEAQIAHLGFADDGTGMLDVEIDGAIRETPFAIAGRLGTLVGLINAGSIEHDLEGHVADSKFAVKGSLADLGSLTALRGSASIRGPDITQPLDILGIENSAAGPFELTASAAPVSDGSKITIEGHAAGIKARVNGTVDSLISPGSIDVGVDLSGPDIRVVAGLAGIEGLPRQDYSVTGHIDWQGFPISLDEVSIRVGPNTLDAHGTLGEPPLMHGTDFRFEGNGPDASSLAAFAGIVVPSEAYSVTGRVVRVDGGVRVEEISARFGGSSLSAEGIVGDPPSYAGTTLELQATIDRPDRWSRLVGRPLPTDTFEISGRFSEGGGSITLEGVTARMGRHTLAVDGTLRADGGMVGTNLEVRAAGSDFSQPAAIAGLDTAPAAAYRVEGGLHVVPRGYLLDGVDAQIGRLRARVNGTLSNGPGFQGTALDIAANGASLDDIEWLIGTDLGMQGEFQTTGSVKITDRGYELEGATARVGAITASVDGLVTAQPDFEGTELRLTCQGPELSVLEGVLGQSGLPASPFSVHGRAKMVPGGLELEATRLDLDGNRLDIAGKLVLDTGLVGTDLELELSVPDLGELGRLAGGMVDLPALPAENLALTTGLQIDERGYVIDTLEGKLARAEFEFDGRIGLPPQFVGTDLTVDSDGPDASLFKALTGVTIPMAPFRVQGRLQRTRDGFSFDRLSIQLAEYQARIDGTLGQPPRFEGTDLELEASGPDTEVIRELTGYERLPNEPFRVSGRFEGTPEAFTAESIEFELGQSDLSGWLSADILGKPSFTARLDSHILDLSKLGERLETTAGAARESVRSETPKKQKGALLFPDEPMSLEILQAADAEVAIRIDHLYLRASQLRDLTIDVHLEDGRLSIDRMTAAGRGEGRMSGSLLFEPHRDVHRLDADISLRQIRFDPPDAITELHERPPIDIDIDLEAVGATPHQLASSTNGAIQLVISRGIFESSLLDLVTADILLTLFNAFNPFAKENPETELECGVALLRFEDGIATLEPMAFQSDTMTLLGNGRIDFESEKLKLQWITKPRKGIGISASMITNPYIKLGGTLAEPSIELKPIEAVTSTGVAVATMGLSLVAKGMFDRISAEKKVCKKALEKIEARARASAGETGRK